MRSHYTRRFLFVNVLRRTFPASAFPLRKKCYNCFMNCFMRQFQFSAAFLLLACACASAAPSNPSIIPDGLSVVPGAGTVRVSSEAARWNFPTRFLSTETPLAHTFLLRNDTKATLTVERVAVSCDCVQTQIGETRSLPVRVAPGQTVPVRVSLSLRRLVSGSVSKSAWLYLHGGDENGLRLELRGTVRDEPAAKFH